MACALSSTLCAALALASGCATAPLTMRQGDAWTCVQQARATARRTRDAHERQVVGWLSVASPDRWIAVIDRLGQEAGAFAPGSSVRSRVLEDVVGFFSKLGIKGVDWLDTARPIHVLAQRLPRAQDAHEAPASGQKGQEPSPTEQLQGMALVVPTRGDEAVALAVKDALKGTTRSGAQILKVGEEQILLARLHAFTGLLALDERRLALAREAGRCVQELRPRRLLEGGVAVSDLLRAQPELLDSALAEARDKVPSGKGMSDWVQEWLEDITADLHQTDAVQFSADAVGPRLEFGLGVRPIADSALARRFDTARKQGPNPLVPLLPTETWLAVAGTWEPNSELDKIRKTLNKVAEVTRLPAPISRKLGETATTVSALSGGHSAAAMYRDGVLRFGLQWIYDSRDAPKEMSALTDLLLDVLIWGAETGAEEARNKGTADPRQAADAARLTGLARTQGWLGLAGELAARSASWPVQLKVSSLAEGELRCHGLDGRIDWQAGQRSLPWLRFAQGVVGDRFTLALCTTRTLGMGFFGPGAYAQARRVVSGKGQGLAQTALYKNAFSDTASRASWLFLLDPSPLMDMARVVLSRLPDWPRDQAVTAWCGVDERGQQCSVALPSAVVGVITAVGLGR